MPDPTLAPSDLDEGAKKLYYKLRGYLRVEFKTWHDGDREALAQTCRWGMRARQAREALPKDKRGRPIMITQGRSESAGEVQHPLVRIAEQCRRLVDREGVTVADRFGQIRVHPALVEERQQRDLCRRAISNLGFDAEVPE